ncbi:serine hydrolase domain-containing protein [Paenibacillus monticola]|uniref:Serine hydrolase n=1 Tax=Paenibacillus monticola TaxID=2666075 RepID=A0A7X2H4Z7_9BACL|nr:serine hydrolase [Paenibacillus monticola]MRN53505.1 serine hydrolase [Paenibacillus monticola]
MHLGYIAPSVHTKAIEIGFSGAVLVQQNDKDLAKGAYGYANKSDCVPNNLNTRFGMASGCKLFTAIAICQLVEQGKLAFEGRLSAYLPNVDVNFPHFSPDITVHHLLTHSSGIPDYFDEETMDDFAELWQSSPMYTLRRLADFIPMFGELPMKFTPGERFHYNNAGYILLGLLVEELSGLEFADYVEQHIFRACGMERSGYFVMDALPTNTALGYIDESNGIWRTNIYSLPVKGGADGGAFVTAPEMLLLWQCLLNHTLLSPELTTLLLTPHIHEGAEEYYGYGVWITMQNGELFKFHLMGADPGVSFRSAVYPACGVTVIILCNESRGTYQMLQAIEKCL